MMNGRLSKAWSRAARAAAAGLLACAVVFGLPGAPSTAPVVLERRVASMGTSFDLAIVASTRETALPASEAAIAEVARIEDLFTTWRNSPLTRLNETPPGVEVALDRELGSTLAAAFAWSARTERAFDPTVLPLVMAWDLRGAGRIPTNGELLAALEATGTGRFRLDPERGTAVRLDARAGIDSGAWAKGYALDRAAERLREAAIENALLDLGGQALALGRDSDGKAWTIAIAHPRGRERPVVTLALSEASASTSGNSERGRVVGGRRIGHLLDPRTGQPANDFGSVTVVASSAFLADVLSSALFVLGPERGLALSAALRREGAAHEVLYLVDRGAWLEAVASPGFARLIVTADADTVHGIKNIQR
jgi:thiamine biosynthesis lipoprotein